MRPEARCKIQSYALVYQPAVLSDGVFVGPAAVSPVTWTRAMVAAGSVMAPDVTDFSLAVGHLRRAVDRVVVAGPLAH